MDIEKYACVAPQYYDQKIPPLLEEILAGNDNQCQGLMSTRGGNRRVKSTPLGGLYWNKLKSFERCPWDPRDQWHPWDTVDPCDI